MSGRLPDKMNFRWEVI